MAYLPEPVGTTPVVTDRFVVHPMSQMNADLLEYLFEIARDINFALVAIRHGLDGGITDLVKMTLTCKLHPELLIRNIQPCHATHGIRRFRAVRVVLLGKCAIGSRDHLRIGSRTDLQYIVYFLVFGFRQSGSPRFPAQNEV